MTRRFLVVTMATKEGYSAFAPDLPGCVAHGVTVEEALARVAEAIDLRMKSLKAAQLPVSEASAIAVYVDAS